jgi:Mg/Co/Ni transporter MgtE
LPTQQAPAAQVKIEAYAPTAVFP